MSIKDNVTKHKKGKYIIMVLSSIVLVIGLCIICVPSVRNKVIDTYNSIIFVPYESSESSQETSDRNQVVKYPKTNTSLSDEELGNKLGYDIEFPEDLADKYILSEKWIVSREDSKSSKESSVAGVYKPKYSSDKAKLLLYIVSAKSEYYNLLEQSRHHSNNQSDFKVKETIVFYYETKIPKGKEPIENIGKDSSVLDKEITEFSTVHSINWKQGDIFYCLTDHGNNVSIEDMKAVADALINN
jgi:hypothetical protein